MTLRNRPVVQRVPQMLALFLMATLAGISKAADLVAPATSSDGNYTVQYYNCGYPINGYNYSACWMEESSDGGATWNYIANQSMDQVNGFGWVTFTGKAPGTYRYRAMQIDYYYYSQIIPSNEVVVVVAGGSVTNADTLDAQLGYQYTIRNGDIDGDGRTDIYVNRSSGSTGNGSIEKFILKQLASGLFEILNPNASQLSAAGSWPVSAVQGELHDVDMDGFADMVLKGVGAISSSASDQVVYAAGNTGGAQPRGVRAMDTSFNRFFQDTMAWRENPAYFDNAPVYYVPVYALYYYCYYTPDYYYGGWTYDCYPQYTLIGFQAVRDYSGYSDIVVDNAALIDRAFNDTLDYSNGSSDMRQFSNMLQSVLGVTPFSGSLNNSAIRINQDLSFDASDEVRNRSRVQRWMLELWTYFKKDTPHPGTQHTYGPVMSNICAIGETGCTVEQVFCELRLVPAPGMWSNHIPVNTGDVSLAHLGYSFSADDLGHVAHTVDSANHVVTNTTTPDHLLHPGSVTREVLVQNGSIYIRTTGSGTGAYPKINADTANIMWKGTDAHIRYKQGKKITGQNMCPQS